MILPSTTMKICWRRARWRWHRLPWIYIFLALAAVNLAVWLYFSLLHKSLPPTKKKMSLVGNQAASRVTYIFREFEDYENKIKESIASIHAAEADANIIVIADTLPYPPLILPKNKNCHLLTLDVQPLESVIMSRPEHNIKTEFVILVPDSIKLYHSKDVSFMIEHLRRQPEDVKAVAWPTNPRQHLHCLGLTVDLKHWTLVYTSPLSVKCDFVLGPSAVILRSSDLFNLSAPFQRPLPDAFFIQTALRNWKIAIGNKTILQNTEPLFQDAHSSWKQKTRRFAMLKQTYAKFGIKQVKRSDGQEEWYGCTKDTKRCFGTVVNNMPDYLYKNRWTPPCCLKSLRTTARHVFRVLESHDVRYWLEGGSLLGAVRSGDIIPWDYDVDIGIYSDDIPKSYHISSAQGGMFEDEDGFVWEKAQEGEFYRVQYSQSNHLHVDVFPFFSRNGTMTKKTWFKDHRQDMEFPEHFLKPLEKMSFVGTEASVPNHAKEFLELKFGKGVVGNAAYPDEAPVTL